MYCFYKLRFRLHLENFDTKFIRIWIFAFILWLNGRLRYYIVSSAYIYNALSPASKQQQFTGARLFSFSHRIVYFVWFCGESFFFYLHCSNIVCMDAYNVIYVQNTHFYIYMYKIIKHTKEKWQKEERNRQKEKAFWFHSKSLSVCGVFVCFVQNELALSAWLYL